MVEVVDADGRVTAVVTRAEMRAGRLRHRAVGVFVRRPSDGAVLAHRRADWKDVWPSYWDLAFGGVCDVGEAWADAAARELAEEAGIRVDPDELRPVARGSYVDDAVDVLAESFEVDHDGPFQFDDGEVVAVEWVPFADLGRWAGERSVCPDTWELASAAWGVRRTVPGARPTTGEE